MLQSVMNALSGRRSSFWFALVATLIVVTNAWLLRSPGNVLLAGQSLPDWPYFFDFLITLPLLYAAICRPGWRRVLQFLLACIAASYWLGYWLIPDSFKVLWQHMAWLRYPVLAGIVVVELLLAWRVLRFLFAAVHTRAFADDAIEPTFARWFGKGAFSTLFAIEYRVWYYALLHRARNQIVLDGDQHFTTHRKDANQADQLAFILLALLELPVLHLVLHGKGYVSLAWLLSGLSLYGLLFLIAEYRATALRPISLTVDELIIRRGVWGLRRLPLNLIANVSPHRGAMERTAQVEIYDANRQPNIVLNLLPGTVVAGRFNGQKTVQQIALGLDEPERFRTALMARLQMLGQQSD